VGNRTRAREFALKYLYQLDVLAHKDVEPVEEFLATQNLIPEIVAFSAHLVHGTLDHRAEIDVMIEDAAFNWKISRMPIVDRNILRSAIFELVYCDDIPPKVSIDEAINIAKKYSTPEAGAFVNGILDKIKEDKFGPG